VADDYQKANFLSSVGEKTPVFVRFSTVTFGREFPDEARNPRGFAIKFYTMEGNYDIVGLNFVSPKRFSPGAALTKDSLFSSVVTPFRALT
jgi:catalase